MIAATRAIVVTHPLRGTPALGHMAERDTSAQRVVEPAPISRLEAPRYPTTLPLAPFIAQLIATHQALPQTRARNRAEPADAALAYRGTQRRPGN
jgi:hypothetical protein